ncbi:holo-[acyl-carrier-protein] synthase [Anaplasmataceae bacterium AB001_6]|nr:holo-[acyl-carrier-protein] synthase [Anaplasmataceae bacterium AB001_6]
MIGVDIVSTLRIRRMIEIYGDKFLKKVFSQYEIEQSKVFCHLDSLAAFFAKRFAAKEAYIKAVGARKGMALSSIEVRNNSFGKPKLYITGLQDDTAEVSMSDEIEYAIAFVIIK